MLKKILRFHSQLKNQNHNCTLVCKIKVLTVTEVSEKSIITSDNALYLSV